jgi:dephospho-CoA kinase
MSIKRLAFSGKSCSGKSTLARYLCERYGFCEHSFAFKLKEVVAELFNVVGKDRDKLQRFGEYARRVDSYVWVRKLVERLPRDKNVVVSDVRYMNEVVALKELGFRIVRLELDEHEQERRYKRKYGVALDDERANHVSETALDDYDGFDYVLDGSKTAAALYDELDVILADIDLTEGA